MLGGSDLMSAYQPLSHNEYASLTEEFEDISAPKMQQQQQPPIKVESQSQNQNQNQAKKYDAADQRLKELMAELKDKKERYISSQASNPPQNQVQSNNQQQGESSSYFDKLFSKRKEIYKVLQLSLIITLGLSIHFLIDHYLSKYLADNEMSFERQLILRLMYPLAVLFILWNLRVFVK